MQELQAAVLMLHTIAFSLSSKVVALHFDNITVKAYLCNQGGTVSLSQKVGSQVAPDLSHSSGCISSMGSARGGSVGIVMYQSMSVTSESLGVEHFQPPVDILSQFCVSSSSFCSLGSIQVSGRTYHRSVVISYSSGTLLDGGYLGSHSSQHVGRPSSSVTCCKRPHHAFFSR